MCHLRPRKLHASNTHNGARPEPHDPEHDIDAKSTSTWVLVSTVVLFISLYFMLPMFDVVMTAERNRKINLAPSEELDAARAKDLVSRMQAALG